MRKLLVLTILIAALTVTGVAQAATFTYVSPYATQTQSVEDTDGDGNPESVLSQGQLFTESGAFAGLYKAELRFVDPSFVTVRAAFRHRSGVIYVAGSLDPSSGTFSALRAVGTRGMPWSGTLSVIDLPDATQFVFQTSS